MIQNKNIQFAPAYAVVADKERNINSNNSNNMLNYQLHFQTVTFKFNDKNDLLQQFTTYILNLNSNQNQIITHNPLYDKEKTSEERFVKAVRAVKSIGLLGEKSKWAVVLKFAEDKGVIDKDDSRRKKCNKLNEMLSGKLENADSAYCGNSKNAEYFNYDSIRKAFGIYRDLLYSSFEEWKNTEKHKSIYKKYSKLYTSLLNEFQKAEG